MTGNPVDAGRQPVATLATPHASARSPRPRVRGRLALLLLGGASMLLGHSAALMLLGLPDRVGQHDLVALNGYPMQYDHAPPRATVGDRVRIWVLAAGPNVGSSFHVVGGRFDTVYREWAFGLLSGTGGSQALGLFPAQGGFVELVLPEAGTYPFVSHVMSDAEKGAQGLLRVSEAG